MDINKYIWSIFDIAKENDVDIGAGKDMFLANLEQKKAVYHGADNLDYAVLGAEWENMDEKDKTAQRETYRKITAVSAAGGRYKDLTAARRENDREKFEAVVAEAVASLEAPTEDE